MKGKSPLIVASLFGALFLLPYCDDDPPEEVGFRYPLAIGNTWEYTRQWNWFHYTDSAAANYDDTTTMLSDIRVMVMDTGSVGGTSGLYRTATSGHHGLDSLQASQYYGQDVDGLYYYGGETYGIASLPKGRSAWKSQAGLLFKGRYFSNVNELFQIFRDALPGPFPLVVDSTELIIEDPPVMVLQYPLEKGTTWTVLNEEGFWIDKVVMGEEEVTVPAGTFECVKVKWFYDLDGDGEWDTDVFVEDNIGEVGLVQRKFMIFGGITTNEYGEDTGYSDHTISYTLEAVSLEE